MAENSKIEWTHHTANLWHGCTKVHAGCDNCYAETLANRWGNKIWGNKNPRKIVKSVWRDLLKFQRAAADANEVHRVFVGSMMDIFEKPMPLVGSDGVTVMDDFDTGDLRRELFANISNGLYPNLMFLLLTKRPGNITKYIPMAWLSEPPANVMYGCSPVNQETAAKLIPQLCAVKGKRFLSVEPMLDAINLNVIDNVATRIDWIIVGGESGHHRRTFNTDWAHAIKDWCKASGTPFFFKQIDKVLPIPEDLLIREFPPVHHLPKYSIQDVD